MRFPLLLTSIPVQIMLLFGTQGAMAAQGFGPFQPGNRWTYQYVENDTLTWSRQISVAGFFQADTVEKTILNIVDTKNKVRSQHQDTLTSRYWIHTGLGGIIDIRSPYPDEAWPSGEGRRVVVVGTRYSLSQYTYSERFGGGPSHPPEEQLNYSTTSYSDSTIGLIKRLSGSQNGLITSKVEITLKEFNGKSVPAQAIAKAYDDSMYAQNFRAGLKQWQTSRPEHYRYIYTQSCYCQPLELHVEAVGDSVIKVQFDSTYSGPNDITLVTSDIQRYSIDSLFAQIKAALNVHPDRASVSYNPRFGYPDGANIDPSAAVADDEFSFGISDFQVLPVSIRPLPAKAAIRAGARAFDVMGRTMWPGSVWRMTLPGK